MTSTLAASEGAAGRVYLIVVVFAIVFSFKVSPYEIVHLGYVAPLFFAPKQVFRVRCIELLK